MPVNEIGNMVVNEIGNMPESKMRNASGSGIESEAGNVEENKIESGMGNKIGNMAGNEVGSGMESELGNIEENKVRNIVKSKIGHMAGGKIDSGIEEKDMEIELGNEVGSKAGQLQGVVSRLGEKRILGEMECMGFYNVVQENGNRWQDIGILEKNEVVLEFGAQSRNEGFARMVAAAFVAQMNPTIEEISDIKTAVSEAVTNAVIHGYEQKNGMIRMRLSMEGDEIQIEVSDRGIGMENVLKAMEPLYTTRPDMERSGMGFAFMEAFMDELEVHSRLNFGTVVKMKKKISASDGLPGQME